MDDITKFQFEELKSGNLLVQQIKNWTNEMKWWLIENNKPIPSNCILEKDMVIALIKKGSDRLKQEHIDILPHDNYEQYWLEGINNYTNEITLLIPDTFLHFTLQHAHLTKNIALALCTKHPIFYCNEEIKKLIPETDKSKISECFFQWTKT